MTDLLDKHSEGYDPERFLEIADDQRKAAKENGLPSGIENAFTGELMDPDDLPALKTALQEIEDFLRARRMGSVYATRERLAKRIAKLSPPLEMPPILAQTETQKRVTRCPNCFTILPSSEPEPQADDSPKDGGHRPPASSISVSTATRGAAEQSSGSKSSGSSAARGPDTDASQPGAAGAPKAEGRDRSDGVDPALPPPDPED